MYKEVRPFACGHDAIQMAGQESFKWYSLGALCA